MTGLKSNPSQARNQPHDHDHDHAHDQPGPDSVGACCAADPVAVGVPRVAELAAGQERTAIRIMQMDCPTEEALIRNVLGPMNGVFDMQFNLMQRVLTVVHHPDVIDNILQAVRKLGFKPEMGLSGRTSQTPTEPAKPWWPLAVAGVAAIAAEATGWAGAPQWLAAALALAAIATCGLGTYRKGWVALRHGNLNINALMSIAVTGAMLLQQWPEAAMVMVLFTLAELIEARSLDRARNAIKGLLELTPSKATVLQTDGSWQPVAASSVALGAQVRIKPGERIGLDGIVTVGHSSVNQAPITGESLPVDKTVGDTVFAGTVNTAGSLEYRVTAAAGDTMLARIIHAVEQAQGSKAPTQRFVDDFARVYTPLVFAFALLVAVVPPLLTGASWGDWVYKALVLLVIACPCALVISTPVTIVSGLAAAARKGILIKGGVYLEQARKLTWLALDKTGTLTHGKPVQTDFELHAAGANGLDPAQVHHLAASLAGRSDHPVSQAIARAADSANLRATDVSGFEALPGRGVRGVMLGRQYSLGNQRLVQDMGLSSPELESRLLALERQGKTVVLLAETDQVLGLFAVADTAKASSTEAIAELHALGIRTMMLTGDNPHAAQAIGAEVGIDEVRGNQLPQDKLQAVVDLAAQGVVGMVGDGINDAPALARADIGFAMGALGTDTAIENADVALMDDDLRKIGRLVVLSRATHAVLVQNIVLALGIKAVFLVLTLAGLGTMWMAVFADVGASLLVVGNGLRLLRK